MGGMESDGAPQVNGRIFSADTSTDGEAASDGEGSSADSVTSGWRNGLEMLERGALMGGTHIQNKKKIVRGGSLYGFSRSRERARTGVWSTRNVTHARIRDQAGKYSTGIVNFPGLR